MNRTIARSYRRLGPVALLVALTFALAACSSGSASSSGSSSSAGSAQSDAPTATAMAQAAAQAVAAISKRPTELSIGSKVTKPVPAGKTIATINCGSDACTIIDNLMKSAAATIGWKTVEIQTDGTAQQIGNAWQQAIQAHVSGIVEAGVSRSEIETYIQQARAAGIAVVLDAVTDPAGNGVLSVVQDGASSVVQGTDLGEWVADDAYKSGDPNASVLYVTIPDFKVLSYITNGWTASIKKYCPTCQVQTLNIGLSSLQQATALVTSKLSSDPSIKYVVFSVENIFDSVPPALKATGHNVKIVGATPGNVSLTQLRSGQITAVSAFPAYEEAYGAMDVFVRYFAGVMSTEPPAKYTIPSWMLTSANAPAQNVFPIVADLVGQYETAWGK